MIVRRTLVTHGRDTSIRSPSSIPNLVLSLDAGAGITLGGTPLAAGTTPPVVTLTGTLLLPTTIALFIAIDSVAGGTARGQATFKYSADGGSTFIAAGVATAATVALTGAASGITANFPIGTYGTTQTWTGTVAGWSDYSGQANNVAQATAGKQPVVASGVTNGLPGVTLDGVDDFFSGITWANSQNTGTSGTFVFVVRANALFAGGTHDFLFSTSVDGINPGVQVTNSNTSLIAGGGLNAGAAMTVSATHVWTFQHNNGSNAIIRRNGVQLASGSDGNSTAGGHGITIGSLGGGSRSVSATLLSVAVYTSLGAMDIIRVEKFFSKKYGLGF